MRLCVMVSAIVVSYTRVGTPSVALRTDKRDPFVENNGIPADFEIRCPEVYLRKFVNEIDPIGDLDVVIIHSNGHQSTMKTRDFIKGDPS